MISYSMPTKRTVAPVRPKTAYFLASSDPRHSIHTRAATVSCPSLIDKQVTRPCPTVTTAIRLLRAGVDSSVVALWLGHEHVDTTQIYIVADLKVKKIRQRADPAPERPAGPISSPGRHPGLARHALTGDLQLTGEAVTPSGKRGWSIRQNVVSEPPNTLLSFSEMAAARDCAGIDRVGLARPAPRAGIHPRRLDHG